MQLQAVCISRKCTKLTSYHEPISVRKGIVKEAKRTQTHCEDCGDSLIWVKSKDTFKREHSQKASKANTARIYY
jgi:hypothetical protein